MRVIVDATHACLDQHREPEFGVGREQEWRAFGVLCSSRPAIPIARPRVSKFQPEVELNKPGITRAGVPAESGLVVDIGLQTKPRMPIEDVREICGKEYPGTFTKAEDLLGREVFVEIGAISHIRQHMGIPEREGCRINKGAVIEVTILSRIVRVIASAAGLNDWNTCNPISPNAAEISRYGLLVRDRDVIT